MNLLDFPKEILLNIFGRVATEGPAHWAATKLWDLNIFGDESDVLRLLKIDASSNFPITVAEKLLEANHPEAILREALAEFFANEEELASYELLKRAIVDLDDVESVYAYCIIRLFSTDDHIRVKGACDLDKMMYRKLHEDFKTRIDRLVIRSEGIQYTHFVCVKYGDDAYMIPPEDGNIGVNYPYLVQADTVVQTLFGDKITWV